MQAKIRMVSISIGLITMKFFHFLGCQLAVFLPENLCNWFLISSTTGTGSYLPDWWLWEVSRFMDCVWLITEGRLCAQKRDGWSCWSRSLIPHVQECVGFDRKNLFSSIWGNFGSGSEIFCQSLKIIATWCPILHFPSHFDWLKCLNLQF